LSITLGLIGLFIMALALFNVSFPNKEMWLTGSILAVLTGIIIYANRTYLNQPEGIKQRCLWHQSLTSKGVGPG
jgi:predicted membrane channel-forming protein YqfA (hemolysin III family)